MLVLKRKESQRIFIGRDIVLTVVTARQGWARIAINAPPNVPVDREEIRVKKEGKR